VSASKLTAALRDSLVLEVKMNALNTEVSLIVNVCEFSPSNSALQAEYPLQQNKSLAVNENSSVNESLSWWIDILQ